MPCSNEAKMRNPLKFAWVPQTTELSRQWAEVHHIVRRCTDGEFLAIFLRRVLLASRVQHVSDLHPKFALRPHPEWKYGRLQSATAEIRRGKKKKEERRNSRAKIKWRGQKKERQNENIMSASDTQVGHNNNTNVQRGQCCCCCCCCDYNYMN